MGDGGVGAFGVCDYFGLLFASYCAVPLQQTQPVLRGPQDVFETSYEWNYINYTWPSHAAYRSAFATRSYVPENNAMAGIKIHRDNFYIALPRIRTGTPVTLAYFPKTDFHNRNLLLIPYPSWEMNAQKECFSLQNVQSMEIDRRGTMWVLDGYRSNNLTRCPPKLVLFDLNAYGKILHVFEFPNEICLTDGGYLNDIVVDESDGGYAYITDNSMIDPGIIIYSLRQNRAWKIRDRSMFADVGAATFIVDGLANDRIVPVDGIALSPLPKFPNVERTLYFCPLAGYNLFSIATGVLKNEELCRNGEFRRSIRFVGRKQSQSDGLAMDNEGVLFYGLLADYGVARWDTKRRFSASSSDVVYRNEKTVIWPDTFAFDDAGFLYVIANGINKYMTQNYSLSVTDEVKFRILRTFTGSKSYLHR